MTTPSKNFFKNKPLETVTMHVEEDGISRTVPALSSYFVTPRTPVQFASPPKKNQSGHFLLGAKEDWLSKMFVYRSNLEWLLSLSHNRFWSQVVYGNDTWDSVISFLQEGLPFYCLDDLPEDEEIQETYIIIMNLVFKIFTRICTQKESKENWIGDKKYGSLLYNYTILSVPIFLDLCVIFGGFNLGEVKKMITNSFEAQPLYKEDLNNSIQHVKTIFHTIEDQFSSNLIVGQITKLSEKKSVRELSLSSVQDIVLYSLDITMTLSTFLDCYSEAASVLHNHRFEVNIASFYDSVVTNLYRRVQETCDKEDNMDMYFTLMFKLNQTRYYLIQLCHQCIQSVLNNFEKKDGDGFISKDLADNFLDILSDCLLHKTFIYDYGSKYPIEFDLEHVCSKCPEIDNTKCNFLVESFLLNSPPKSKKNSITQNSGASTSSSLPVSNIQLPVVHDVPVELAKNEVHGVELESLVTEVKDILPHLGDDFVKKCLTFYNYSSSTVINAILENNLPVTLSSLSQTLPNEEFDERNVVEIPKVTTQSEPEIFIPPESVNPYFPNRVNVFDNDEFDIMTRDHMDTSRIFKGKRNDPKERDLKDILNDKTFREDLRNKFSILGLIEETDSNYDDEYDDTYDDPECPVLEAGEQNFHKFVTPRVLEQVQRKEHSRQAQENGGGYQEDSGEEDEEISQANRNTLFIENPELVRARQEEQRLKKWKQGKPGKEFNVAGNPKGQGQDKEVLVNRNKKTINKSYQGNHNRKKGAQFKRFQGI